MRGSVSSFERDQFSRNDVTVVRSERKIASAGYESEDFSDGRSEDQRDCIVVIFIASLG